MAGEAVAESLALRAGPAHHGDAWLVTRAPSTTGPDDREEPDDVIPPGAAEVQAGAAEAQA